MDLSTKTNCTIKYKLHPRCLLLPLVHTDVPSCSSDCLAFQNLSLTDSCLVVGIIVIYGSQITCFISLEDYCLTLVSFVESSYRTVVAHSLEVTLERSAVALSRVLT